MSLSPRQLVKNSGWTFLELVLYPLLMIAATPVFIHKLGIEHYGLWMLVSTISLGMNVFNVGMGDTNIRMISAFRAANDQKGIRMVFNHNFTLSVLLFLLACLVGLVLSTTGFIRLFYQGSQTVLAQQILLLACISAGLKFIELTVLSVFKAFERFDRSSRLTLLSKNSVMLVNIALVLAGHGLAAILLSTVVINVLNILVQLLTLQRFQPLINYPSFKNLRFASVYSSYNIWYWLQSVIGLLGFLADKLVVAWFTDVKTLGYYSIASLIGTQINNFFVAFGSFIFPRVSYRLAANDGIGPLYYVARSFIALPGWSIIALLLLFGDTIFRLWLGPEVFGNSIVFIKLYLVFQAGMLLIIVPHHIINGSRMVKLNSLFEITIRSTHLLCMLGGHAVFGIQGILYGLIFSTFLNLPFQYFFFHKRIIPETGPVAFLQILLPVCFLTGLLLSDNFFYQLSLAICLVLSCKLIYFDPARTYSQNFLVFRSLFARMESK